MKLIQPYFVVHGEKQKQPIRSMPGQFRFSVDELIREVKRGKRIGIGSIILFGIPQHKDAFGSEGYAEDGIVAKAIRAIKAEVPGVEVIADVCLCEYTSHGHCGIIKEDSRKQIAESRKPINVSIDLKKTLELYAREAVVYAEAGADIVAPSGMMKGQVGAIRKALDKNGYRKVKIMGYSAKYASAFYGPFRDAVDSAPAFGDRTSYQLSPNSSYQTALAEVAADIREGADIVMVKPGLAYLDVVREVKRKFKKPLAAYCVSGEYSMLKAAAQNGWLDEKKVLLEILAAFKRAGVDWVITYLASNLAKTKT